MASSKTRAKPSLELEASEISIPPLGGVPPQILGSLSPPKPQIRGSLHPHCTTQHLAPLEYF